MQNQNDKPENGNEDYESYGSGQPPRDELMSTSAEDRARNLRRRRALLAVGVGLIAAALAGLVALFRFNRKP